MQTEACFILTLNLIFESVFCVPVRFMDCIFAFDKKIIIIYERQLLYFASEPVSKYRQSANRASADEQRLKFPFTIQ